MRSLSLSFGRQSVSRGCMRELLAALNGGTAGMSMSTAYFLSAIATRVDHDVSVSNKLTRFLLIHIGVSIPFSNRSFSSSTKPRHCVALRLKSIWQLKKAEVVVCAMGALTMCQIISLISTKTKKVHAR